MRNLYNIGRIKESLFPQKAKLIQTQSYSHSPTFFIKEKSGKKIKSSEGESCGPFENRFAYFFCSVLNFEDPEYHAKNTATLFSSHFATEFSKLYKIRFPFFHKNGHFFLVPFSKTQSHRNPFTRLVQQTIWNNNTFISVFFCKGR